MKSYRYVRVPTDDAKANAVGMCTNASHALAAKKLHSLAFFMLPVRYGYCWFKIAITLCPSLWERYFNVEMPYDF